MLLRLNPVYGVEARPVVGRAKYDYPGLLKNTGIRLSGTFFGTFFSKSFNNGCALKGYPSGNPPVSG